MLSVHHLNNSRSQRMLWLLRNLGFPTRSSAISVSPTCAPGRARAVHPLGKSPVNHRQRQYDCGISAIARIPH